MQAQYQDLGYPYTNQYETILQAQARAIRQLGKSRWLGRAKQRRNQLDQTALAPRKRGVLCKVWRSASCIISLTLEPEVLIATFHPDNPSTFHRRIITLLPCGFLSQPTLDGLPNHRLVSIIEDQSCRG
jgi:hypothetical protein